MATLALNKSELKNQNDKLKTFKKFVPSLELKRKTLIAEINKGRKVLEKLQDEIVEINERLITEYPMVSDSNINIDGLIHVNSVKTSYENVVGIKLPRFEGIDVEIKKYEFLDTPLWLDCLSKDMIAAASLRFQIRIAEMRMEILAVALRKTTQRLNLFEKVMIPETVRNIKKIKIYLSDAERAFVVQAKIAKRKFLQQTQKEDRGEAA